MRKCFRVASQQIEVNHSLVAERGLESELIQAIEVQWPQSGAVPILHSPCLAPLASHFGSIICIELWLHVGVQECIQESG